MMNPGRRVGLLYLLLLVAPLRLIYIPTKLFVRGDATATANNIAAHETLFRFGIFSELFTAVVIIFLTLAFYRLYERVDRTLAVQVIILGGILPAGINFVNVVNDAAALTLIRGADYLVAFDKPQRDALAFLFLQLHHKIIIGAQVLWGVWLLPLGLLTYRSGFFRPAVAGKVIGVWLLINGVVYVVLSLVGQFAPRYEARAFNVALPALLGEMALMLWLLIRGVDAEKWRARKALTVQA